MAYTSIYQNSYVILVITFIVLCIIFYIFKIGYNTELKDGKVIKTFSWKYPLAISLIVWLIWHFYLYPPGDISTDNIQTPTNTMRPNVPTQKIIMENWN
ncbi:hypothetical protein ma404 [Moumouvirus australiensis]|uniref:Uncharacterized protein n=1 Tax=Moumouvirus australiensis TaxID=2109587 RepID=A0A2P1ELN6_9VIRU|nr:hypothetical protein QKC55_gp501 [Moumouvirus australiensis]AVL94790.1 hypothetical protein ma404 [Moumouvirus australiensis]